MIFRVMQAPACSIFRDGTSRLDAADGPGFGLEQQAAGAGSAGAGTTRGRKKLRRWAAGAKNAGQVRSGVPPPGFLSDRHS